MSFLSNKYDKFIEEELKKKKIIEFYERQKKYKEKKSNEATNKFRTRNINK